ncbi:MAG: hypothetical protein R2874_16690 [Desulfobacterales bacterium]
MPLFTDVDVRFLNQFQIDFEKTGIGLEISDPGTVLAFNHGLLRVRQPQHLKHFCHGADSVDFVFLGVSLPASD